MIQTTAEKLLKIGFNIGVSKNVISLVRSASLSLTILIDNSTQNLNEENETSASTNSTGCDLKLYLTL